MFLLIILIRSIFDKTFMNMVLTERIFNISAEISHTTIRIHRTKYVCMIGNAKKNNTLLTK